jgi:hypothetical protein
MRCCPAVFAFDATTSFNRLYSAFNAEEIVLNISIQQKTLDMDYSPNVHAQGGSSIDLSKDFEFQLEFEVEEDIEGELEDFVRLARLGLTQQAREKFQQTLSPHLHLFPVFAEYAELLVTENAYEELLVILPASQEECGFSEGEWALVTLLRALASSYTAVKAVQHETTRSMADQQLETTLQVARKWHDSKNFEEKKSFDEIDVRFLYQLSPARTNFSRSNVWKYISASWSF